MVFEKKNTFRSRKREVRQYRARLLASCMSGGVVLMIGLLVWYGARRPEVTISNISVSGGATVSHDAVRDKVDSVLSGTYGFLIPHRFSFSYPQEKLVEAVNAIPRIHGATIVRSSLTGVDVTFEEYVPYALWCDAVATQGAPAPHCLFVDERGYAYADAPPLFGETLVRFVTEQRTPTIAAYVYDTATLSRYRHFVDAIAKNHQHRLGAITETKDGDLILHLSGDVDLLMTKDADIQDIFDTIESIFESEEFKGMPLESFEYIDLRFGNKVYVKQRGAGEEEPVETASSTPAQ